MAENKVKHLYYTTDMKLNITGHYPDPGIGGGSTIGFNATAAYETFLARMNADQLKTWTDFYQPISDAFYQADYKG
jgi:hypothetical protein